MLIREALQEATTQLESSLSDRNLSLDSSLLLCHVLGITREKLYAMLREELPEQHYRDFTRLLEKRSQGFPLAYLTGIKEFYGRDFHIAEGLLCPRPDTEILVEQALLWLEKNTRNASPVVLDLCCGTGCIGLTLAAERKLSVTCSDISPVSKEYTEKNRHQLGISADVIESNLFDRIEGSFDLIVSNPPYLTSDETEERMQDRWKEPALALDGGSDGLDLIRLIIDQAPKYLKTPGALMIEADPRQMEAMKGLMEQRGFTGVEFIPDLADDYRVIKGEWNV